MLATLIRNGNNVQLYEQLQSDAIKTFALQTMSTSLHKQIPCIKYISATTTAENIPDKQKLGTPVTDKGNRPTVTMMTL